MHSVFLNKRIFKVFSVFYFSEKFGKIKFRVLKALLSHFSFEPKATAQVYLKAVIDSDTWPSGSSLSNLDVRDSSRRF